LILPIISATMVGKYERLIASGMFFKKMKYEFITDFIAENGEALKSGMSGEMLIYSAKFEDLLDEAVKQKLITRDEANNWDVRVSNNLLNVLNIPNSIVEADEQEGKKGEYDWVVYWR